MRVPQCKKVHFQCLMLLKEPQLAALENPTWRKEVQGILAEHHKSLKIHFLFHH